MLQLGKGDNLFVYDVLQDNTRTKIAELDINFNDMRKTFSSTGNHSLLVHFSTDDSSVRNGFLALIRYIPSNETCAYVLDNTDLILTQEIDCSNFIITAPFVTSTITIQFEYFEVYI